MKEIDWSKAPADATHYNQFARTWIKHLGNGSYQFLQGDEWGMGFGCMDSRYIERPKPDAWSGEGLPPVGTVCEVAPHNSQWGFDTIEPRRCTILAYHADFVWLDTGVPGTPISTRTDKVDFNVIRTPEQIAAEEREKEVDALCYDIVSHYEAPKMSEHYLGLAKALHAAGYRKVTP